MINRAFACAAVAVLGMLAMLPHAKVHARGFSGHAVVTPLGVRAHHAFRHRHHTPYGGWIAAYPSDYYEPIAAIPELIAPAYTVVPHCTPSVETVRVPAEAGGERQITIRRCSP
jgi:hypothetical protein